ncbi:MAG: rod shape-determining protein MreD [Gammaproteobacteria bacterium]|nr:rod shape-determining protein MreD [Gammaproteobacteria bacterium]MDH5801973.1 rod shape-determining protein MreD [Gammaproteobacteria bacterium]
MALVKHQGGFLILLTFIASLILSMIPMPSWLESFRPLWVVIVLIYWVIALPDRVGVFAAWVVGLMYDVASGALLGQNALAMAFIAYLGIKLHLRIRIFPLWQQAMSILVLVALYQMLSLWIKGMTGVTAQGMSYWLPSLSSMLVWPLTYMILRAYRRHYKIR